jgi:hypothetical protein
MHSIDAQSPDKVASMRKRMTYSASQKRDVLGKMQATISYQVRALKKRRAQSSGNAQQLIRHRSNAQTRREELTRIAHVLELPALCGYLVLLAPVFERASRSVTNSSGA